MKIVIDARWIFEEISGIGQYTTELIGHLARIDRDNEYILLFSDGALMDRTAEQSRYNIAPNFETRIVAGGVFSLRGQREIPALLHELRADVFHAPNYLIPFRAFPRDRSRHTRCVVTLHDVIPLVMPDHAPRSRKRRLFPIYRRLMKEVALRADAIIAVSECSRRDVIEHLDIPGGQADRVSVVYNGVAERFKPSIQDAPRSTGRTLLYVGRMDPYKNLTTLVKAFGLLTQRGYDDLRLQVIGPEDERYPEAPNLARSLGLEDRIDWSGYLPEKDGLLRAYQAADIFVLPSQYEGFGLPVLEAMACGTPVVCSNSSSLPEVAGTAARLVDPEDVEGFADTIGHILDHPLEARAMREAGLAQAAEFTWIRAAEQTRAIYESFRPPEDVEA